MWCHSFTSLIHFQTTSQKCGWGSHCGMWCRTRVSWCVWWRSRWRVQISPPVVSCCRYEEPCCLRQVTRPSNFWQTCLFNKCCAPWWVVMNKFHKVHWPPVLMDLECKHCDFILNVVLNLQPAETSPKTRRWRTIYGGHNLGQWILQPADDLLRNSIEYCIAVVEPGTYYGTCDEVHCFKLHRSTGCDGALELDSWGTHNNALEKRRHECWLP